MYQRKQVVPAWDQRFSKDPKDTLWCVPRSKALQGELSLTRGHHFKAPEKCPDGPACSSAGAAPHAPWFHVLLPCSTLWYSACVQLTPLPRLCLNTFASHTLLGSDEGQGQQLQQQGAGQGLTAANPPVPRAGCSLPLASAVRQHHLPCSSSACPAISITARMPKPHFDLP